MVTKRNRFAANLSEIKKCIFTIHRLTSFPSINRYLLKCLKFIINGNKNKLRVNSVPLIQEIKHFHNTLSHIMPYFEIFCLFEFKKPYSKGK